MPAGLCVIPRDPLPVALHLSGKDLADAPAFPDRGRKMILSASVTGFRPGEELTLEQDGTVYTGLILERLAEADTSAGPWNTQLLVEVH